LPRLPSHQAAIPNRLLGPVRCARLCNFCADVLVARHALARYYPGGNQNLNAMADRKQPLSSLRKVSSDVQKLGIVPKILRRSPAKEQDGVIVADIHLVEGDVGFEAVPRPLHVGVPAGLEIMQDQVKSAFTWSSDYRDIARFPESMDSVQRFV
jgi:hypothetical protein